MGVCGFVASGMSSAVDRYLAGSVNMTEAVLFDNDGVLVDTEILFFHTTQTAFRRLDLALTPEIWGLWYLAEGNNSREVALRLGAGPERVDGVLEERNREFRRLLQRAPALRPHVRETLAKLHGVVKLAIVTGGGRDHLALVHATSNLLPFFDVIITSDDCSSGKPHPEPYLAAIRMLDVHAENCVAVEDTPRWTGVGECGRDPLRCCAYRPNAHATFSKGFGR